MQTDGKDRGTIESRWAEVNGLSIHYLYADGPGPPVILVPGGMVDSALLTWKYVLEGLAGTYKVYVLELPGYGKSDKPDASYTTEYYVDFLARFIDAVAGEPVVLCGSSMAGAHVLGVALRRPDQVRALVLSGGYGVQDRVNLHEAAYLLSRIPEIDRVVRGIFRKAPALFRLALPLAVWNLRCITTELVRDTFSGVDHDLALRAFKRWMRTEILPHEVRTNFTAVLSGLQIPVLLIHGEHDLMMPVAYTRRAAGLLPDAELHIFDAGHLVPREWPGEVVQLMHRFIREKASIHAEPR